jgi:hypothetical protein
MTRKKTDLGSDFLARYLELEEDIQKDPYIFQKKIEDFRRGLLDPFPYSVWYEILEKMQEVDVKTITH